MDQIPFLFPVLPGPSMWVRVVVIIAIIKSGRMPIVLGGSAVGVVELPDEVTISRCRVQIFLFAVLDAASKAKSHRRRCTSSRCNSSRSAAGLDPVGQGGWYSRNLKITTTTTTYNIII